MDTFDVPGAYLQKDLPKDNFALLLLEENFVGVMCDINPQYKQHPRFKYARKTVYLHILMAIYGVINSDILRYELYGSVLRTWGFN